MASRNSAAVSSSHFTESLDCAWMELPAARNTNREQIAARFIEFPPEPPCILALFQVLKTALFRLNPEAEDDKDLHDKKADHHAEDAANSVRPEQGDGDKGRENRRPTAKGVADSGGPQTNFGGEQFRNVNREERRNKDVDGNGQQETDGYQSHRLMDERINAAEHDGEKGRPNDCRLAPPGIGGESADGRSERRAERHAERVTEGCDDAQPLLNEEGRQPGHETEDQSIHYDQSGGSHDHARKQRRAEQGTETRRRLSG